MSEDLTGFDGFVSAYAGSRGSRGSRGSSSVGMSSPAFFALTPQAFNEKIADLAYTAIFNHGGVISATVVEDFIANHGTPRARADMDGKTRARTAMADCMRRYQKQELSMRRMTCMRYDTHLPSDSMMIAIERIDSPDSFPAILLPQWAAMSPQDRYVATFDLATRTKLVALAKKEQNAKKTSVATATADKIK